MNKTKWKIEAANCAGRLKGFYLSPSTHALKLKLQQVADKNRLGELHYRYELDDADQPVVIHTFFTGRDNRRKRFMRLRREGLSNASR